MYKVEIGDEGTERAQSLSVVDDANRKRAAGVEGLSRVSGDIRDPSAIWLRF